MSFGKYIEVGEMDALARIDSAVHRLDARTKAVTTLIFIAVVMSFPRYEISALMPFFVYPFVMLAAGNIPPYSVLKKLLIASPFALAVGIFNPFLDTQVMLQIGGHGVTGGWISFLSIILRFALTVSAALILVASTGIHRLCAGLGKLGLPGIFTVQLLLLYRYMFVIAAEGIKMKRSVELRSSQRHPMRFRTFVSLIGNLLVRSMDRAQRIYKAMVSRGFSGHIRVMSPSGITLKDAAFMTGWILFFAAARSWDLADMVGRIITGALR